jgi:hypothetical protein
LATLQGNDARGFELGAVVYWVSMMHSLNEADMEQPTIFHELALHQDQSDLCIVIKL